MGNRTYKYSTKTTVPHKEQHIDYHDTVKTRVLDPLPTETVINS